MQIICRNLNDNDNEEFLREKFSSTLLKLFVKNIIHPTKSPKSPVASLNHNFDPSLYLKFSKVKLF